MVALERRKASDQGTSVAARGGRGDSTHPGQVSEMIRIPLDHDYQFESNGAGVENEEEEDAGALPSIAPAERPQAAAGLG